MKVSTMIIFGSNCSEFVLIWIIVLLIKILNTFWICINAGGWNDNYPEYPRPQYFTKYQMHHIVQDGTVLHIPVHTLIVALQISMKFWSTAWGEIKLEGKFVLYSGTVIPNVFKSNISKGLMRNLYQNGSYCIFIFLLLIGISIPVLSCWYRS